MILCLILHKKNLIKPVHSLHDHANTKTVKICKFPENHRARVRQPAIHQKLEKLRLIDILNVCKVKSDQGSLV